MGRLDNLPDTPDSEDSNSADLILKTVTQDLRALQQDLVSQLSQDVKRLQSEKSRLLNDIETLQAQQDVLRSDQQALLSQKQLAQQQLWAKQLAQALAAHLQAALIQRMNQQADPFAPPGTPTLPLTPTNGTSDENAYRLLSSLDATLNRTLTSLRQDLTSYQSSLSQQINRMQTLEQQGEAILQALVNRLGQHLQADISHQQASQHPASQPQANQPPTSGHASVGNGSRSIGGQSSQQSSTPMRHDPTVLSVAPSIAPEPSIAPLRPFRPQGLSHFQLGLVFILLSTMALSLHNVVVGIIGNPSSIFGIFQLGGYIQLNNLGNSLWILWFRMVLVVPMMALLASTLYPPTWQDIKTFFQSNDRRLLRNVVGSGFFLFLSQVLIYIAIGQVGPGVAVTILFMYPLVTVPLAWWLFGDRPSALRWRVMFAILFGVILTAFPKLADTTSISFLGIGTAMISGIAFAFYLISMQISFRKLHPVSVSVIQFFTIFFLTSLSLLLPMGPRILPDGQTGFIIGGILLGTLTLLGYLLNNFGVRYMGAARASIVASSGPVLTALLAFMITPGPRTALHGAQWFGIVVVTLGVVALSFEKMVMQSKLAKQSK